MTQVRHPRTSCLEQGYDEQSLGTPFLLQTNREKDVSILPGNGDGTLRAARSDAIDATYGGPNSMAAGDSAGDGRLDLVTRSMSEDGSAVYFRTTATAPSSPPSRRLRF